MDFLNSIFASFAPPQPKPQTGPCTRWEKAVTAVNSISKTVAKVDSDGVDVYCFPGADGDVDKYMQIKQAQTVKDFVTAQDPGGDCNMSGALTLALDDAFERGFDEKPCSVLVVTAGQPEDKDAVVELLQARAANLENPEALTLTFVQVGQDPGARDFLQFLENDMELTSGGGEPLDIVDTIKDEELKAALDEMACPTFFESGGAGGLAGAFAGMAAGAGAYYLYNKHQAAKRTEGWNGTWEVVKANEATGVQLTVADDGAGNITIEGYPEDDSAGNPSGSGTYEDTDDGYSICRQTADGSFLSGEVISEHEIEWPDDTVWKEVPPEGVNWMYMAGAALGGAAVGGAVGYLVQKKFFNKANNSEPSNYIIVVDRSEQMTPID